MVAGERRIDSNCAGCDTEGRPVERQTVLHHAKPYLLDRLSDESYRFCPDPICKVVYFGNSGMRVSVNDLREPVTVKTKGDARPICYCFGFIEGDVRSEIELTGRSAIPTTISRLIKQGMCACEVRNPSGACCLGEVKKVVERFTKSSL